MAELMTLEEVAELTRLSPSTLRFWRVRQRGEGPPSFRVGGRVRYRREVVEAWLRDQEVAEGARR